MKKLLLALLVCTLTLPALACRKSELHIVTTGDIHGRFFSRSFAGDYGNRPSLMSVKHYVDSLRAAVGPSNVILLDVGDILQGDNASYYYNYVAKDVPHVYPRMAAYMGYDACTVGNHDIETGHPVYDRVYEQMKQLGIPWLAGNAFKPDGSLYFPEYTMLHKGGRKILVLGYNNANIDNWLPQEYWSGMTHVSLIPLVQDRIDRLRIALKPDAVVVLVHSGTGKGDGKVYENQGLDIFNELHGADVLICGHDHQPGIYTKDDCVLVDGGARCSNVGHVVLGFKGKKVVSRKAETVAMKRDLVDRKMVEAFDAEWQAVRDFTQGKVGTLTVPLHTRDAYAGVSDFIDLLHTVQLEASGAQLSLAAPLSFNGNVKAGDIIFNDMFTIYPYENQLYVLNVTGGELKRLMEYSYDKWICTPGDHVLRIKEGADARSGAPRWSFENRSYNFD
ncbi:MAG: bifunctional metallophosphatase/5'-nucleotidase, partial [Bacteroidales bacterium]|nr:bifunctional metallophosphatase/5'-nucleotidase [Bacteroidales bacterium]